MDKLAVILEEWNSVYISCAMKRMEVRGVRDFHVRYIWKAQRYSEKLDKDIEKESKWEGFSTPTQCVNDMYKKLAPRKKSE